MMPNKSAGISPLMQPRHFAQYDIGYWFRALTCNDSSTLRVDSADPSNIM